MLRIGWLSLSWSLACFLSMTEAVSDTRNYAFRPLEEASTSHATTIGSPRTFHWRPLTQEGYGLPAYQAPKALEHNVEPALLPPGLVNPPSLPRGVYRPVEEVRPISPQIGAFRFRTIEPDEQLRLHGLNPISPTGQQAQKRENRYRFRGDPVEAKSNRPAPIVWDGANQMLKYRPNRRFSDRNNRWSPSQTRDYTNSFRPLNSNRSAR